MPAVEKALEQPIVLNVAREQHTLTLVAVTEGAAWLHTRPGRLQHAARLYRRVLWESSGRKTPPSMAMGLAHTRLGMIMYEQNNLTGAVEQLSLGIANLRRTVEQRAMAWASGALAPARPVQGDVVR